LNPPWASLRAAAAPMPLPPAVMIATFSTIVLSPRLSHCRLPFETDQGRVRKEHVAQAENST
jgi:hypothetical protein